MEDYDGKIFERKKRREKPLQEADFIEMHISNSCLNKGNFRVLMPMDHPSLVFYFSAVEPSKLIEVRLQE